MFEAFYEFKKIFKSDLDSIFESTTKSCVPVKLIFKAGDLKSILPVYTITNKTYVLIC
jgi:hypothetical protein